jgi:hypothetical protein
MKSKQFPSLEEAEAYLQSRGKLEYGGREGTDAKTHVYSLTVGMKVYVLLVDETGLVRVIGDRYKGSDE